MQKVIVVVDEHGNVICRTEKAYARTIMAAPQSLRACRMARTAITTLSAKLSKADPTFLHSQSGQPCRALVAINHALMAGGVK